MLINGAASPRVLVAILALLYGFPLPACSQRAIFGVKVAEVRVANREGKWKRMGKFIGQRKGWKKAYVRLAAGEKPIEFFEGV